MKLVRLVLALLFGGLFIDACEGGPRRGRSRASDPGAPVPDRDLYGDEDEEGW